MSYYGPQWPLKKGTEDTFARYETAKDQISFYLKNLLLRSFLFEQNLEQVTGEIQAEIEIQIRNYLPYLDIVSIDFVSTPQDIDTGVLGIRIEYRLPGKPASDIFELEPENSTTGFY